MIAQPAVFVPREAEMRAHQAPPADWIQVIRSEYLEMPGLHLTGPQAQRLWALDAKTCDVLLNRLIAVRFLKRTPAGAYVRADRIDC